MLLSIVLAMNVSAVQAAPGAAPPTAAAPAPAAAAPGAAAAGPEAAQSPYDAMVHAAALAAARHLPVDDDVDRAHRMFSSDRNKDRYFNRPGATRAVYESEWNACRQIARRLAWPQAMGGPGATIVQPGLLTTVAATALVSGLQTAFAERRLRRDIRRQCLMARGWRMVEPDEAGKRRIDALSRAERDAYFDRMLGAEETEPGARVTDWHTLTAASGKDPTQRPVDTSD